MEQEERISLTERGKSRNRSWVTAAFVTVAMLAAALSLSVSSNVVSTQTNRSTKQRDMDLSIAFSINRRGKKINQTKGLVNPAKDDETGSPSKLPANSTLPISLMASGLPDENHSNSYNCFPYNTKRWLTSERISNIEDVDLSASFEILQPPLPKSHNAEAQFQAALEETLCLDGSRFLARQWVNSTNLHDEISVRVWTTRIVYVATTFHQYYLAWEELNHRRGELSKQCKLAWDGFRLSQNDFECPKARFLVIPLGDNGLGANFKLGAMAALKTSLASGRIALYINHFNHTRHRWLQKPWTLASCPRRDYQCFFMPPSPCVLTYDEYQSAYLLNKTEMRMLFRQGNLPHLENERVIVYSPNFRPQREPPLMRDRLSKIGTFLVRQGLLPDTAIVQRAIQRITEPADARATAFVGDEELAGGLLLYVSRPQSKYLQELRNMQETLLTINKLSTPSIGLPIRASDKCDMESECFDFETYVHAAHELWMDHQPESITSTKLSLVVTTESADVVKQERAWINRSKSAPWEHLRFDVVHNSFDVTQNTGLVRSVAQNHSTADQVMLSSLSSLRAQLLNRVVLGNCCSNFHRLMQILVRNGCSSDWDAEFVCLQHHPNEAFRLCCAWDKSDRCRRERATQTGA